MPGGWHIHVRAIQFSDRRATKQLHGSNKIRAENFDCPRDSGPTARAKAVGIGASNQYRFRTETERLRHVATAADASVQEYLRLTMDGINHFGECAQRG